MESLAAKYRPRTFDDLVGQRPVQVILRQMVHKRRVFPVLLFDGPRGTGKTTTLRILAAALNCHDTPVPCGQCVSCKSIYDGSSPDLLEIDAASNGLVDDIRNLRQQVLYATGGDWQIVGLDEAHGLSTPAANALLKTIEEPPPNTVFVLLTTEPGKILDTVVDRCMPFTFRRIVTADIAARLRHICTAETLDVEPALITHIAERADGGMRDAIMTLDQVTRVGVTTLAAYTDLMGECDYGPTLLDHLVTGDLAAAFAGIAEQMTRTGDTTALTSGLIGTLRDILVLHAGGQLPQQDRALAARQRLARHIDRHQAVAALKILWDLKTKIRIVDDPRSSLDLAVVLLGEIFAKARPAPPASAPRKLTLAEMQATR